MNLDLIKSEDLKNNITKLYNDTIELVIENNKYSGYKHFGNATSHLINKLLYKHIMGVGVPISICNSDCVFFNNHYNIVLVIDYKVTSGYKPYQDLDKPITIEFKIDESILRDRKIDKLLC